MEPKLITSMYSRAVGALVLAFLVALVLASSMPSAMAQQSGMAASYDFDAEALGWEWTSVSCANMDGEYELDYRSRYRWAEFCGSGPTRGAHACLQCLQVTNPATSDDVSVTARIIDICESIGGRVMFLDKALFDQIDTDGQGNADGKLEVNYEVIDCPDE